MTNITIFVMAFIFFFSLGTKGNAYAADLLCQIGSDYDQDGDIDGADLQQFAADLKSGTVTSNELNDFAQLFATDDVDSALVELQPILAMMVATDTDRLEMAWTPGTDGETPPDQVKYDIYLGTSESFIPDASTLVDTVIGANQIEISGLSIDTLYYGKVIATYNGSTSCSSDSLQTKTYPFSVQQDPNTVVAIASDLGLGKHTTVDGITYIYSSGIPPPVGSILFSEDIAGGMTIRRVESTSILGGEVTVITSDASLTDVLDRAANYTSFKLFDVVEETATVPASALDIATAKSSILKDGSRYSRIDWKDQLLSVEQTTYAYEEDFFSVKPQDGSSVIQLLDSNDISSEFEATVTAHFEPKLITSAEWGGIFFEGLESAHVGATGILSLNAIAQYNFSAAGSVKRNFTLWSTTWTSVYTAGPVPVYQDIKLTMDVAASASALAAIQAMAQASLTETVEVGAIYDGSTWTPYITHNENTSLTASLDIKGEANAEIRLIPKIEVKFYKVISASLTVEPFADSGLTFAETTNNFDFLTKHPEYLIQLTSFNASLGMEANVAASLSALGLHWDILPSTCVLGTGDCLYPFNALALFSIPYLELTANSSQLQLQVTDGIHNSFNPASVEWEVFPDDATIQAGFCSRLGFITTCSATLTPGENEEYTVFASGYGVLGEMGRQFKEITLSEIGTVTSAGQVWMDRNLGASRVATSMIDSEAYGDLYQWGRLADGHESRTSPTTSINSSTDDPGHGSFITEDLYPWDWRVPQNNNLWQGESGINNPCPAGFRLPTDVELNIERASWSSNDQYGAFASPLKLVAAGCRGLYDGTVYDAGSFGYYWSSTVSGIYSRYLNFYGYASMSSLHRAHGFSARCLED